MSPVLRLYSLKAIPFQGGVAGAGSFFFGGVAGTWRSFGKPPERHRRFSSPRDWDRQNGVWVS